MSERKHDPGQDDANWQSIQQTYAGLDPEAPPELLDQAVLNSARRAVVPPDKGRTPGFGWLPALSTGAVLVLCLGLFSQLQDRGPTHSAERAMPPEAANARPQLRTRSQAIAADEDMASPAPALGASAERRETDSLSEESAFGVRELADDAPPASQRQAEAQKETRAAKTRKPAEPSMIINSAIADEFLPPEQLRTDPAAWLQWLENEAVFASDAEKATAMKTFRTYWPDYPLPGVDSQ